jgi:hypothetical protein
MNNVLFWFSNIKKWLSQSIYCIPIDTYGIERIFTGALLERFDALCLCVFQVASAALPNCTYVGVFAFGDSLSNTGNSIAAFPNKFANPKLDPNGILFPTHTADRFTDGKLLVDFHST